MDVGIDNAFIASVAESLSDGQSALFLLAPGASSADLKEALGDHGGTFHETALKNDTAGVLGELAEDQSIVEALDQDA